MAHRLSSRNIKHRLHTERIKDVSEKLPTWHGERRTNFQQQGK